MGPVGGLYGFSRNVLSNSLLTVVETLALEGLVVSQESGRGATSRTAYVQGSSRPASGRVSDYLPSIFP